MLLTVLNLLWPIYAAQLKNKPVNAKNNPSVEILKNVQVPIITTLLLYPKKFRKIQPLVLYTEIKAS